MRENGTKYNLIHIDNINAARYAESFLLASTNRHTKTALELEKLVILCGVNLPVIK